MSKKGQDFLFFAKKNQICMLFLLFVCLICDFATLKNNVLYKFTLLFNGQHEIL